jgi:hypothetical protein
MYVNICKCMHTYVPRYIQQNTTYAAVVILKKVEKVKVEIGLGLLLCLYLPVMFNLLGSVFLIQVLV